VAVAVAVALGGCGGGVTKKDVIARGNAICANAVLAIRSAPPSKISFARVAAIVEHEAAQLRALPRPAQDRALLGRYVAAAGQLASDYRKLAAAEQSGDRSGVQAAFATLRSNPAPQLAARYGLRECARPRATVGSG
jgi:hypothetical protein